MNVYICQGLTLMVLALFALMTGFFYAFSVAVMPGLDAIDARHSIPAMQSINLLVRNPVFFITFFVTPVAALVVAMGHLLNAERGAAALLVVAAAVYGLGVLAPTTIVNVPMNNALAAIDAATIAIGEASIWTDYSSRWTLWNSIRAALCLCATLLVGAALPRLQQSSADH